MSNIPPGEGIVKQQTEFIWQDREIRFDSKPVLLACRKGEMIIDSINSVEDTKGNNGERGSLVITNLRMLWISHTNNRINLSIGLSTILTANIRQAKSKLRGHTQALCVLAKFNTRFEFIFTSLVKNSPRMFTTTQTVLRAYETSKLYRDLKLRGSIIKDNDLVLLPQEQIFSRITGVWNLSSEQGNLGVFFFTNVRLVWHANLAVNFNVSLPYIQIKSIRLRESKFGRALVIETFAKTGGYILGFRIDPRERIRDIVKELCSLFQVYSATPNFGVDFSVEAEGPSVSPGLLPKVEEDVEVVEEAEDVHAVVAAYYAENQQSMTEPGSDGIADERIMYESRLGLAMEILPVGMTLDQLWKVV